MYIRNIFYHISTFTRFNFTPMRDQPLYFLGLILVPVRIAYWLKTRASYTTNSWIFTTNHKRISVNYFNFVLVAGTAGMSLATVIRLEFAYPGVGVLAGDSLQYLSTATAHGVIMVFYMIMPSIFGAFGNFLLPTQLGVHDVAFPRLNSAAFWFLPGGLIMLCQLVCTDRRYARMNCFNIRELQGILKRRFFADMVNSHDHRDILGSSMISTKFKLNTSENVNLDATLFYNWGVLRGSSAKFNTLGAGLHARDRRILSPADTFLLGTTSSLPSVVSFGSHNPLICVAYASRSILFTLSSLLASLFNSFDFVVAYSPLFSLNARVIRSLFPTLVANFAAVETRSGRTSEEVVTFTRASSERLFYSGDSDLVKYYDRFLFLENASSQRVTRFSGLLVSYDYKTGHYLGAWDKLYPQLMLSFIEVARGIRKPS